MSNMKATPVLPVGATVLRPGSMEEVQLNAGFWGGLQSVNASATIPHEVKWLKKFGALGNFQAVVDGTIGTAHIGRQFADSDIYKVLEAIAWEVGRTGSPDLQKVADELVEQILPAVQDDGYLNTQYGHPGLSPRYSEMDWGHELYCYGHLIQAGVARLRTGFDRTDPLAALAIRIADHVCDTFGSQGLQLIDGHPEIEPALVELYRATGDVRYLRQAQIFVDRRGHRTLPEIEFGREYFQDEIPIRQTEVLHGHAVRALYLAAGAIDLAVETADIELLEKVQSQYLRALDRRTYITGGMGSHHQDEAFGDDYELPPDRAYCETCAGIASIMVAWRLLLATGDLSLGDVIERTLYNILATSMSEDGTAFFYANPLHQRTENQPTDPEVLSIRASSAQRAAWFEVSCCPPNLSRTLAQLASYVATSDQNGVQLIQYMSGTIVMQIRGGETVGLKVETDYPNDSQVRILVTEAPQAPWDLSLRIPVWAQGATVTVNGEDRQLGTPAAVLSDLKVGDLVCLDLPLRPRFIHPHQRIDAIRGCVAVEWGPLVMCAESVDQLGKSDVAALAIDVAQGLQVHGNQLIAKGQIRSFVTGTVESFGAYAESPWPHTAASAEIVLTPYWAWANRGATTMRIWIPTV